MGQFFLGSNLGDLHSHKGIEQICKSSHHLGHLLQSLFIGKF